MVKCKIAVLVSSLIVLCSLQIRFTYAQAQRPNVIYIMTDDMGYGDLSSYGQRNYVTPNIDRLASQGMRFINAYSAGSVCTPTRTAYMTGRYAARTPVGLMEPLRSSKTDTLGLTSRYPSLATLMKQSGYETALIGKWHLGFFPQHSPIRNGFEYFYGILSGAADYLSYKGANGMKAYDLYENDQLVYPRGYLTDIFTQKAIAFLKQKHDKPFFLTLTFNAPHWPWQGPGDDPYPDSVNFRSGGSPAIYAAMMKSLDEGIGQIMSVLDDEKLSDHTIVIFTNDNGGEKYSDNGGLTKSKGTLWEGGIRVPAIVRWPDRIKEGTISKQVVVTMDWTATILALGGAKAHKDFPLDGIDLTPMLTGSKENMERTIYWRTFQLHNNTKHKAVRMGDWKYLQDETGEYLFDLSKDQKEMKDLKEAQPTVFKELKNKFASWETTVLPPIPLMATEARK